MRSWILVPADNEKAMGAVASAGADVVVLDLSRASSDDAQLRNRIHARDWVRSHQEQVLAQRHFERWVKIGSVEGPHWRADLEAIMEGRPDGVILSDCAGTDHIQQLAAVIYEVEQRQGIGHGATKIVPQLGSNSAAALSIAQFAAEVHPRVSGLTWDAAVLARSIGARRMRGPGGAWSDPMAFVRAQVLFAAHARGIESIEPPYRDARDTAASKLAAEAARADGFSGMVAIHPSQVPLINEAFEPTSDEIADAQDIVAAFASNPSQDHLPFKGRRIGQAQKKRAERLLGAA